MQIYFHSRLWSYLPRVPILVEDTVYIRGGRKNRFMYESRFNVLTIRIDSKVLKIDIFFKCYFLKITCCGHTKKTEANRESLCATRTD